MVGYRGSSSGWSGGSRYSGSSLQQYAGATLPSHSHGNGSSTSSTREESFGCKSIYELLVKGMREWGDDYKYKELDLEFLKNNCGYKVLD